MLQDRRELCLASTHNSWHHRMLEWEEAIRISKLTSLISEGNNHDPCEESWLHTTQSVWRGVQTKLQPETLGLLLLPLLSYSLAPFHQRSPRAGKLGPWAKSCQLQALVNKVLLECSPTHLFTLCLWLLSRSTSRVNSVRQSPQLSKPSVFTVGPSLLKLCYFH